MDERHRGLGQVAIQALDVTDLERQHAARPARPAGRLGEEQREVELVLHRDRATLGNLELELQPERRDVPVTRLLAVTHGDREVVELDHGPPVLALTGYAKPRQIVTKR